MAGFLDTAYETELTDLPNNHGIQTLGFVKKVLTGIRYVELTVDGRDVTGQVKNGDGSNYSATATVIIEADDVITVNTGTLVKTGKNAIVLTTTSSGVFEVSIDGTEGSTVVATLVGGVATATVVGSGGSGGGGSGGGGAGSVNSVTAGSNMLTVSPTSGDVVVDVVPANFSGIPQSAITNLTADLASMQSAIDGKAPLNHTHPESDITNLVTDLSNINSSITTIQSDITTIQTDLAGKIDEVIAGTNLSGGGSSGSVTLNVVDSPVFAGGVTINGSDGLLISTPSGTSPKIHFVQGALQTWTIQQQAGNHSLQVINNGVTTVLSLNSGGVTVTELRATGNVTLGNATSDQHAINGVLNANSTAGSNGDLLTIVGGLPKWQSLAASSIVSGTGTSGRSTRWTGTNTVGTGAFTDDGTNASLGGLFGVTGLATFNGGATAVAVLTEKASTAGTGVIQLRSSSNINYIQSSLDATSGSSAELRFTNGLAQSTWAKFDSSGNFSTNNNTTLGSSTSTNVHTINGRVGQTSSISTNYGFFSTWTPVAGTSDNYAALRGYAHGTFDTTSAQLQESAIRGVNDSTRSAGANSLINIGVTGEATGGQDNRGVFGYAYGTANGTGVRAASVATGSLNCGVWATATGAGTTNVAGYFSASGAGTNYAIQTDDGDVFLNNTGGSTTIKGNTTIGNSTSSNSHTINGHAALTSTDSTHDAFSSILSVTNAATTSKGAIYAKVSGTADTTGGVIELRGVTASAVVTRSAGTSNVINNAVVADASGGDENRAIRAVLSGSGTTNLGAYITSTATGVNNYGVSVSVTGAGTTNYGLVSDVTGGTNNRALVTRRGRNYLNTTDESTGIGYAEGASLPAKLSVSGTTSLNGNVMVKTSTALASLTVNGDASIIHAETDVTSGRVALLGSRTGSSSTASGDVTNVGASGNASSTKSAGTNSLINIGGRFSASNGDVNVAIQSTTGSNYFNTGGGSTGIGYALGAALPAKLSVNGALSVNSSDGSSFTGTGADTLTVNYSGTSIASNRNAISIVAGGTLDATGAARIGRGLTIESNTTRSAGANSVTNIALEVNANNTAQVNVGIYQRNGANYFNALSNNTGFGYAIGSTLPAKLSVNGTLSATGNCTLGDSATDSHTIFGSLNFTDEVGHPSLAPDSMTKTRLEFTGAGFQPAVTGVSELGRSDLRWAKIWTGLLNANGEAHLIGGVSISGTMLVNNPVPPDDGDVLTVVSGLPKWQALSLTATDISGLADIATSGSASDLVAGTVPAARMPAHTGDVTSSAGSVALTIANNAVTNTKLRDSAGLSVIGRASSTTGDPADIVASTDGHVLRRSGTTLGFGTIPQSSVTNLVSDLASKASASSISGTTGKLAKFTSGSAVGDSIVTESVDEIFIDGKVIVSSNVVVGGVVKSDEYQVGSEVGRLKIGHRVFTSGTSDWSVTPGTKAVRLRMVGGGGGGGGVNHAASGTAAASGGNSGTYFEKWIDGGGSNITSGALVIGTGGAGGFGNAAGSTGGNTTVIINGTLYTATGGKGGPGGATLTATYVSNSPAANATSSAGDLVTWTAGYLGFSVGGFAWQSGSGGSSPFGNGGVGRGGDGNGNDASGYGGGGGGAAGGYGAADRFGGSGSPGIVIIEEYA